MKQAYKIEYKTILVRAAFIISKVNILKYD